MLNDWQCSMNYGTTRIVCFCSSVKFPYEKQTCLTYICQYCTNKRKKKHSPLLLFLWEYFQDIKYATLAAPGVRITAGEPKPTDRLRRKFLYELVLYMQWLCMLPQEERQPHAASSAQLIAYQMFLSYKLVFGLCQCLRKLMFFFCSAWFTEFCAIHSDWINYILLWGGAVALILMNIWSILIDFLGLLQMLRSSTDALYYLLIIDSFFCDLCK